MPQILVATDFSKVSEQAIRFTADLAADQGYSVLVVHSILIPVTFNENPMPVMPLDESRDIAEGRLSEILATLRSEYAGVDFSSALMYGDIVDSIDEYCEDHEVALVVVGNSGTGNTDLWLGSSVLSALKHLKHPVIAVPLESNYKRPVNICLACDFKHVMEHLPLGELQSLVSKSGAQLHVLNVDYQNREFNTETSLENKELHQSLASLGPVFHYVEKEDVDEAIAEFVETNHMDWLVIVPHKHGFFEGLFHKSHTKGLMKSVRKPLIALHKR